MLNFCNFFVKNHRNFSKMNFLAIIKTIKEDTMARRNAVLKISKSFSKRFKRIREILYRNDPAEIKKEFNYYRNKFTATYRDYVELMLAFRDTYNQYRYLLEEKEDLERTKKKYYNDINKLQEAKDEQQRRAYYDPDTFKKVADEVRKKQAHIVTEQKRVDKKEQELIVKQEELEIAMQETNLARSSYYRLTEAEMELFQEQRPRILAGIEKYGSISLAIKNDAHITMRASAIMYYAKKHEQFAKDLEMAQQVFKDSIDATMIDRALNGTMNPVFQKGEYIGDYAVKDNKLLVEVAKAKLPETYNPRAYAAAHPQSSGGTTINILSFDGVDETKHGYTRNVGVVTSVDDSGRVERITQQQRDSAKMIEFYKNKGTAEIIDVTPEPDIKSEGASNGDSAS